MTKWKGEAASYAPHAAELISAIAKAGGVSFLAAALLLGLEAGPAAAAENFGDSHAISGSVGVRVRW